MANKKGKAPSYLILASPPMRIRNWRFLKSVMWHNDYRNSLTGNPIDFYTLYEILESFDKHMKSKHGKI